MQEARKSHWGRIGTDHFFRRGSMIWAAMILALLLFSAPNVRAAITYQAPPGWRDAGAQPVYTPYRCFDATQPNTLLLSYDRPDMRDPTGTYAYDWVTGQYTPLSEHPFNKCSEANGLLFAEDDTQGTTIRFSRLDPRGRPIAHAPTHIAVDGTLQLYALDGRLWASDDGGLTWRERGQQFHGAIGQLVVSAADARAIYALTQSPAQAGKTVSYSIYFSADAGATWERRFTGSAQPRDKDYVSISLAMFDNRAAPVQAIQLSIINSWPGLHEYSSVYLSIDGARTIQLVGENILFHGGGPNGNDLKSTQLLHIDEGVLRLAFNELASTVSTINLSISSDGGQTWRPLALPSELALSQSSSLLQANGLPSNLFLTASNNDLWHSSDSGRTWQKIAHGGSAALMTPYLPLVLLHFGQDRLYALDLPAAGNSFTVPVMATGASTSIYFSETGHNLNGIFKQYWEANGGLAQFGYPKTEAFRELNPADGQVYMVQYFERNRFEHHPELAGTRHEVLLGLLGNQVTEQRRAGGEAPFNRVDNPNSPGQRYFPETGHILHTQFNVYWEANGGLEIYGYPISEAFFEVNPADGQTYLVQYFERNRFEYHPELAGTRYEVLLGLLGNRVLQQKGWQP